MYAHHDFAASIVTQRQADLARSAAHARQARIARAAKAKRVQQAHTTETKQWSPLRARIVAILTVHQPVV